MLTNAELTVFNRYLNLTTQKEEYRPTKITPIHFYTNQKVAVDDGLMSAELYEIRIPIQADTQGRQFINQNLYRKLSLAEVDNYWTISNGDYFVRALVEKTTIANLIKLEYSGRVLSYSDNRRGILQHFRIGGGS